MPPDLKTDRGPLSPARWAACPLPDLFAEFKSTPAGLTDDEVVVRRTAAGPNEPSRKRKRGLLLQLLSKLVDPLIVVLLVIAGASLFFGDRVSAAIVLGMSLISVGLSFFQEARAGRAAEKLSQVVRARATVLRGGRSLEVPFRDLVEGDVVDLYAGDMIPADLRVLQSKDLFLNQSALTGESLPVEKSPGAPTAPRPALSDLINIAFMGSSVVSGTGLGLVVATGNRAQFGAVVRRLAERGEDSAFDRGVQRFVWFMVRAMLVLVSVIFLINLFARRNLPEAFFFALAVAVGLTPEMLPMLVTLNLSRGALALARKKVIVKRLNALQNLGAMDVLCTDKTGTLTEDKVVLESHCDVVRREDESVLRMAYLNSHFQTGLKNLLDRAILSHTDISVEGIEKVDEIPFDFSRRLMSVVVTHGPRHRLLIKGAPEEIYKRCDFFELDGETLPMDALLLADLRREQDELSRAGFRVLAMAFRDLDPRPAYGKEDESHLTLKGYLAFLDPPKPSAGEALRALAAQGVECKILTGDNSLVTETVCRQVGLEVRGTLSGTDLDDLTDDVLSEKLATVNVLSRLSPLQKERLVRLLKSRGRVVGFLGDGINDALALKAADVGISVDTAVDIAKESADLILLQKSLMILSDGVREGRRTFANILKYIRMGASSNFGNMLSMTGASLILPFLPMLPLQVLVNNFLYDLSQLAIPTDRVDESQTTGPRPWDIARLRSFMFFFGPISSLFDFLTFGVLLKVFHADAALFHTGWFMESIATQTLVIHVIRTERRPWIDSRSSRLLLGSSLGLLILALALPFSPFAPALGFVRPPAGLVEAVAVLVLGYLFAVQSAKKIYVRRYGFN